MESLIEKLPVLWRLVFWLLVTVAIPGMVSFTVLQDQVGQIQADVQASQIQTKDYRAESEHFKTSIANKLEEIQRSIGRVEGKLDERK